MNKLFKIIDLSLLTIILCGLIAVCGWLLIDRQTNRSVISSLHNEKQKLSDNLIFEGKKNLSLAEEYNIKYKDLSEQKAQIVNDNQILTGRIETLTKQLDSAKNKNESLAADNLTISQENYKLKNKIEILNDQIGKAANEYRVRIEQLAEENDKLGLENDFLVDENNQLSKENKELSGQNASLTEENNFYLSVSQKQLAVDDVNNPNS